MTDEKKPRPAYAVRIERAYHGGYLKSCDLVCAEVVKESPKRLTLAKRVAAFGFIVNLAPEEVEREPEPAFIRATRALDQEIAHLRAKLEELADERAAVVRLQMEHRARGVTRVTIPTPGEGVAS